MNQNKDYCNLALILILVDFEDKKVLVFSRCLEHGFLNLLFYFICVILKDRIINKYQQGYGFT